MSDDNPVWDDDFAQTLIGAVVLIGLTFEDPTGVRYEQIYGVVTEVDAQDGVTLVLSGSREGETYSLPPQTNTFEAAPKGDFRLRSTGEIVRDPDFIATWTIHREH